MNTTIVNNTIGQFYMPGGVHGNILIGSPLQIMCHVLGAASTWKFDIKLPYLNQFFRGVVPHSGLMCTLATLLALGQQRDC